MDKQDWWMEEFKSLRTESMARFRLGQTILSFAMVLIAGSSALVSSEVFSSWTQAEQVISLALISVVFSSLSASYFRHERYISISATYIEDRIYSKTDKEYNEPVLEWERFLHTSQKGRWLTQPVMLAIWAVPVAIPAAGFFMYSLFRFLDQCVELEFPLAKSDIAAFAGLVLAALALGAACLLFVECAIRRSRRPRAQYRSSGSKGDD